MTQRNFQNARNQGSGPKGKTRKSASSAKIKSKAGSSVYVRSKSAKGKGAAKNQQGASNRSDKKGVDPVEQERRRENAMRALTRDMPEYKKYRRIWWVLMAIALIAVVASWVPNLLINNGMLSQDFADTAQTVSTIGFVVALVILAGAFYIDLVKIRKLEKQNVAKAHKLSKSERKELDAAIQRAIDNDEKERAQRKANRPWNKKKQEKEDASEEEK